MATMFKSQEGYVVIRMSTREMIECFPGTMLICDHSNEAISGFGYYIPVLNHLLNKESFEQWNENHEFYEEDLWFEKNSIKRIVNILSDIDFLEKQKINSRNGLIEQTATYDPKHSWVTLVHDGAEISLSEDSWKKIQSLVNNLISNSKKWKK